MRLNCISKLSLATLLLASMTVVHCGCKSSGFQLPKPNFAFWKKDDARFASTAPAPPASRLDPSPTTGEMATGESVKDRLGRVLSTAKDDSSSVAMDVKDLANNAGDAVSKAADKAVQPIRKPYSLEEPEITNAIADTNSFDASVNKLKTSLPNLDANNRLKNSTNNLANSFEAARKSADEQVNSLMKRTNEKGNIKWREDFSLPAGTMVDHATANVSNTATQLKDQVASTVDAVKPDIDLPEPGNLANDFASRLSQQVEGIKQNTLDSASKTTNQFQQSAQQTQQQVANQFQQGTQQAQQQFGNDFQQSAQQTQQQLAGQLQQGLQNRQQQFSNDFQQNAQQVQQQVANQMQSTTNRLAEGIRVAQAPVNNGFQAAPGTNQSTQPTVSNPPRQLAPVYSGAGNSNGLQNQLRPVSNPVSTPIQKPADDSIYPSTPHNNYSPSTTFGSKAPVANDASKNIQASYIGDNNSGITSSTMQIPSTLLKSDSQYAPGSLSGSSSQR